MRCLFVMPDHPVSPNTPGGGPVVMYAHLELMAHAGVEIHLLLLRQPHRPLGFEEYVVDQAEAWSRVDGWCASHSVFDLSGADPSADSYRGRLARSRGVAAGARRFAAAVRDPFSQFPIASDSTNLRAMERFVKSVDPHLVWAENLLPAVIVRRAARGVPMVYGHHDWIWRILQLNDAPGMRGIRGEVNTRLYRRAEELLVREVDGCVSPSAEETKQLRLLNRHVAYLPPTYTPHDEDGFSTRPVPPRIVHLGDMRTVASRVGLERFLDVVWPALRAGFDRTPELVVIGSLEGAAESLRESLSEANAFCPGFVQDLSTIMRPYDIHVIPWEHRTGSRTRVPLALNYSQVVVSTRAAVAGLPELTDGEDCVLVDELSSMAETVRGLVADEARRLRIGRSGRTTFMKHFTREGVQPRFDRFVGAFECRHDVVDTADGQTPGL